MIKQDLFARVQQLHKEGHSIRGIAKIANISKSAVGRMVKSMQDFGLGTATLKCPKPAVEGMGTPTWDRQESVPTAGFEASGTVESGVNSENEPELQHIRQDSRAFEALLMWSHRQNLQSSYQDFLYNTRTFLISSLPSEELARALIKSRQERVRDYIKRARGICFSCQINYEELYMAYVLEQLYRFFGQQPELEETERGLRIKASAVIETFLKQIARLDVLKPMGNIIVRFPGTDTL